MQHLFIDYIVLILIILALVMVANKLRLAYPIVLVLGGLALSLTDEFSQITISPDLVFLIFLPPLLYEAAWQVSWKEFWRWRRVITSFAFPIVIVTSCVIALVSHALIPGFTLSLGFLLGGIISPPDAISATTIMRQVNVPKPLVSIAEGESLLNDASSLIVFRFALAAVITGQFQASEAATSFLLVVLMGISIGLLVGVLFYIVHRWLPTTPSIDIVLTLVTPYCMYYAAEHFHFSGVLAVVSGGLLLSSKRQSLLTYQSRIQSVNVWGSFVFVLNGLVFMLIGLQLPSIVQQLGTISLSTAIGYGLVISLVLIATRLLCTIGASYFTRIASRFITVAESNPGWKNPLILGWAGMRGVVSLAAAISIPLVIREGEAFPLRNLILFITFIVILATLVFQGLTLPWLIRKLKLEADPAVVPEQQQELIIRQTISRKSLQFLEKTGLSTPYLTNLSERLTIDLAGLDQKAGGAGNSNALGDYQRTYLELLQQQRTWLSEINRQTDFDEDLIRKHLSLIDLEELKIREKLVQEDEPER
ncbi:Na+/H+ antiporter [Spirosoma utsteinense]|uniref:CPA1 family monovalent cation:H+ antiporter n=1 Tax=Spirosoma utsteinense TaxID=2585773 RepID=A0ABR6WA45_9BACT|nr:Na+/H+ antiporter [Spirosoma utsteinense]MBC3784166.1 CPA1 family monovalent cation:H+ antiporter [Spirosoma utsteinense]MBC3792745.1 CPA1 family monovalent cation:H+ antiporter [Spirosoma utsteinense]